MGGRTKESAREWPLMADDRQSPAVTERTVEIDGRDVTIEAAESASWVRSPVDFMRLIVATVAVGLSVLGLSYLQQTAGGLSSDFAEITRSAPGFFTLSIFATLAVVTSFVPVIVFFWLLVKRHWRLFGLYLLTTVIVRVILGLLADRIAERVPDVPNPPDDLPTWTADLVWTPQGVGTFAAALVVSGPWMTRRWRRTTWLLLLLVIPSEMLVGLDAPSGLLVGLATGWFVGSATIVAFGSPQRNPTVRDVVEGMSDAGIDLVELRRAGVDARGSTPYFGVGVDGKKYFVKVLGVDERSADLMFRVYRWIRLSGVGDERPFSSLRRAVEHEAMVSAMAERAGVVTPPIVAPVALRDDSMALVV